MKKLNPIREIPSLSSGLEFTTFLILFFNHAQHVSVAGVDCNKCHGPVEEMEILYQYSSLTMVVY